MKTLGTQFRAIPIISLKKRNRLNKAMSRDHREDGMLQKMAKRSNQWKKVKLILFSQNKFLKNLQKMILDLRTPCV